MSAKFMYSLSEENPDLQKQIGCMNGLFQLFDRHHFIGSRRISSSNHKRLPPGQNGKHGTEPKVDSQKIKENNLKKTVKEKQRFSFESPRTSFSSSSCSSSFSSADCSKTSQVDRSSLSQTINPEIPRRELSSYRSNASLQSSQQSLDIRNVVKDSIYREAHGLSIKTATKVEAAGRHQTLKYIDSPRPSPKPAKTRSTSFDGSSRVLPKFQEVSRMSNEHRDSSLSFAPRDAPRFSYDGIGKGSQDAVKIKLKDLPRLSLDSSRESSIKGSINSMKSNFLPGELQRSSMNSNDTKNQQQEPGSYKGPSSVVARLMGLEASPNLMINGNQRGQLGTCQNLKDDPLSSSSRTEENKQSWISGSPRNLKKEPSSPRLTNVDSKKPVATRCPIEPAPWRQLNGNKGQASASKCQEVPTKVPNSSLTVYGEIEKRLAELEFKKSGKDLRALKQILEAMQKSKQKVEIRKEDQSPNFISHTDSSIGLNSDAANLRKLQSSTVVSVTSKGTCSPTSLRSPITIIKPAKSMEIASNSTSAVVATGSLRRLRLSNPEDTRNEKVDKRSYKDLTPRPSPSRDPSNRLHSRDKSTAKNVRLNSLGPSPTARENPKLVMSSETRSLKLQQKKDELEKQSHLTVQTSDQRGSRRQSGRLQAEAGLPERKPRHKSHNLQRSYDQLSDMSNDIRDFSHQGDASSMQSDSNMSTASCNDVEVTSTDRSFKIEGVFHHGKKQNNPPARFAEGDATPKTSMEQPSPVSVLDATFYGDESPSPVKKKSNAFKDDESLIPGEADWSAIGLNHLSSCRETSLRSKTEYKKAENIQHLVQKLMNFDSVHEINEISPVYQSPNSDHKYIFEILLASGLLTELDSSSIVHQLHQSGHLINPKLFPALEQTKASMRLLNEKHVARKINQLEPIEKNHRQLIFDAVNEVLVRKLVKHCPYKQSFSPVMVDDRRPRGQQLVRDLCSEIDNLQTATKISLDDDDDSLRSILWGDLTLGSVDWTEGHSEIPCVVLDVERLIFKDLICELISGEAANLQGQPGRHCRRLVLNVQ